jgi:hypothetical protein
MLLYKMCTFIVQETCISTHFLILLFRKHNTKKKITIPAQQLSKLCTTKLTWKWISLFFFFFFFFFVIVKKKIFKIIFTLNFFFFYFFFFFCESEEKNVYNYCGIHLYISFVVQNLYNCYATNFTHNRKKDN